MCGWMLVLKAGVVLSFLPVRGGSHLHAGAVGQWHTVGRRWRAAVWERFGATVGLVLPKSNSPLRSRILARAFLTCSTRPAPLAATWPKSAPPISQPAMRSRMLARPRRPMLARPWPWWWMRRPRRKSGRDRRNFVNYMSAKKGRSPWWCWPEVGVLGVSNERA